MRCGTRPPSTGRRTKYSPCSPLLWDEHFSRCDRCHKETLLYVDRHAFSGDRLSTGNPGTEGPHWLSSFLEVERRLLGASRRPNICDFILFRPQIFPSNPQAAHLLGKPVCVSSIDQTASQGRNCSRPTD